MRHQWFVVLPFEEGLPRPHCQQGGCQLEVMHGLGLPGWDDRSKQIWHFVLFCEKHGRELMEQERRK